jgi:Transglutaminase-like superfamily
MAVEQRSQLGPGPGNATSAIAGGLTKVGLALEVLSVYAWVRWLLLRREPVSAVSALRRGLVVPSAPDPDNLRVIRGRRFGRAVIRVLRLLPTDGRCLMRSLVLTGMLARRGVYSTVVIGVRPGAKFEAHAWVEVDGQPLLPADEPFYQRLVEI